MPVRPICRQIRYFLKTFYDVINVKFWPKNARFRKVTLENLKIEKISVSLAI